MVQSLTFNLTNLANMRAAYASQAPLVPALVNQPPLPRLVVGHPAAWAYARIQARYQPARHAAPDPAEPPAAPETSEEAAVRPRRRSGRG